MLKRLKDIVYDINDVIVVLAVLALAAFLIWNRMGVIMAYPTSGAALVSEAGEGTTAPSGQAREPGGGSDGATGDAPGSDAQGGALTSAAITDGAVTTAGTIAPPPEGGQPAGEPGQSGAEPATPPAVEEYPFAVYINYGETAAQIAQKLLDGGIISDKNEFYDALIAAKAERKLLAGSFVIPHGSSPADIVRILTGG